MEQYKELPWDIETTIENMQDMKEMFKQQLHKINFEGKGIEDGQELEFDFNRAIYALWKQIPKKPKRVVRNRGGVKTIKCPLCKETYQKDERYTIQDEYCGACGKLLDSAFRNYCGNCGHAIESED